MDRDLKLMYQDRQNGNTALKTYQSKDIAAQQKARADIANRATAQTVDTTGRPQGQHSWVNFLAGMDKNPWAAHKAYVAPTAAEQQVAPENVPQGLTDLNAKLYAEQQARQQQRIANAQAGYAPMALAQAQNQTGGGQMTLYKQKPANVYNLDPTVLMEAQKQAEEKQAEFERAAVGRAKGVATVAPSFQPANKYSMDPNQW